MDPVSVTVSGGYKPLYQKSTSGYLHVMQRQASCPLPAHVTDSNLLVHWPWIQAKPWCTGKQLPPGFNPMDLLIIMTKYTLILAPLEVFAKRTFLGQGPETAALPDPEQMENKIKASSVKLQAASIKLRRCCTYESKKFFYISSCGRRFRLLTC